MAAGSPAFEDLVAQHDAFTIERLRAAGAILIGLTNMPPMANGGMQRGVYGRAEPLQRRLPASAFGSGSSNGSGTATAAVFAAFGLGEETWSCGRAPASNNGLCAYTPSRGVISVRGNWPWSRPWTWWCRTPAPWPTSSRSLTSWWPTTRTPAVISGASSHGSRFPRPLPSGRRRTRTWPLPTLPRGRSWPVSGSASRRCTSTRIRRRHCTCAGHRRPDRPAHRHPAVDHRPLERRPKSLEAAGAEVVVVDFPVVSNYEGDRPGAPRSAPGAWSPPTSSAERSSTFRPGPGTTSWRPTPIRASTRWRRWTVP